MRNNLFYIIALIFVFTSCGKDNNNSNSVSVNKNDDNVLVEENEKSKEISSNIENKVDTSEVKDKEKTPPKINKRPITPLEDAYIDPYTDLNAILDNETSIKYKELVERVDKISYELWEKEMTKYDVYSEEAYEADTHDYTEDAVLYLSKTTGDNYNELLNSFREASESLNEKNDLKYEINKEIIDKNIDGLLNDIIEVAVKYQWEIEGYHNYVITNTNEAVTIEGFDDYLYDDVLYPYVYRYVQELANGKYNRVIVGFKSTKDIKNKKGTLFSYINAETGTKIDNFNTSDFY